MQKQLGSRPRSPLLTVEDFFFPLEVHPPFPFKDKRKYMRLFRKREKRVQGHNSKHPSARHLTQRWANYQTQRPDTRIPEGKRGRQKRQPVSRQPNKTAMIIQLPNRQIRASSGLCFAAYVFTGSYHHHHRQTSGASSDLQLYSWVEEVLLPP